MYRICGAHLPKTTSPERPAKPMSTDSQNLASRSGNLVESHTSFQPRVIVFYFMIAAMMFTLTGGLAYQQLIKSPEHSENERVQNQRRIVVPGPRGNIYDREGRLLVGNHPRFAVVIYLDELRAEFRKAFIQIRKNYRATGDKDIPSSREMEGIARSSVAQSYLDKVSEIIGRKVIIDARKLNRHFSSELLIPFTLVNDLTAEEYARLIEKLPVKSPLQVTTSSVRYYPFGGSAAHTLGSVSLNTEVDSEELPGADLATFNVPGPIGRDGLEKQFDRILQGMPGGTIFRVDPAGYRINPPLERRLPVQGKNITSSLDMDIQQVAEEGLGEYTGAAVMMDVHTGEVLTLASKPDFASGGWLNRALSGVYMPGSTFKLITTLAGFRKGTITPESSYNTNGTYVINRKVFRDHQGCMTGEIDFLTAIENSVNTFFFSFGVATGVDAIASEAKRFGLDQKTGIELPYETRHMLVGTPEWKKNESRLKEPWYIGDTVNMAIGQGFIQVTPLQMACFMCSLARGETRTKPTLIHQQNAPTQKTEPIGVSDAYYKALVEGMRRVVSGEKGSARFSRIEGMQYAGKTGTAQFRTAKGTIELAWFVGFAPVENPEVAFAVIVESDTPDDSFAGGRYAAPIAKYMLEKWHDKKLAAQAVAPKIGN